MQPPNTHGKTLHQHNQYNPNPTQTHPTKPNQTQPQPPPPRPIKSNIAEAHGQIAQLLEAEYPPEEAERVPLMQPDALGAALEF